MYHFLASFSLIDKEDPEKNPRAQYKLVLSKTMLFIPSDDPNTSLALRGELTIALAFECIAAVKDQLWLQIPQGGSLLSESLPTYQLSVDLTRMCPFMCSSNELDGRSLNYISRRKIVEPVSLSFDRREFMQLDKVSNKFTTSGQTSFKGDKVFVTISYQDIMYLSKAFVYNMKMLEKEYFARLIYFNELKGKGRNVSEIVAEDSKDESSLFLASKRNTTVFLGEDTSRIESRGLTDRSRSEYFAPLRPNEENIWQVVSEAMSAVDQLKKASRAVAKYKEKASIYARKNKTPVLTRKFSEYPVSEHGGNRSLKGSSSFNRSTGNLERGNIGDADGPVYERVVDTKSIVFDSLKIVLLPFHTTTISC